MRNEPAMLIALPLPVEFSVKITRLMTEMVASTPTIASDAPRRSTSERVNKRCINPIVIVR